MNNKKAPNISPLLLNDSFVSDFAVKVTLFNHQFENQCSLLGSSSSQPKICTEPFFKLDNIVFIDQDILNIIRNLKDDKAHGWDEISIGEVVWRFYYFTLKTDISESNHRGYIPKYLESY